MKYKTRMFTAILLTVFLCMTSMPQAGELSFSNTETANLAAENVSAASFAAEETDGEEAFSADSSVLLEEPETESGSEAAAGENDSEDIPQAGREGTEEQPAETVPEADPAPEVDPAEVVPSAEPEIVAGEAEPSEVQDTADTVIIEDVVLEEESVSGDPKDASESDMPVLKYAVYQGGAYQSYVKSGAAGSPSASASVQGIRVKLEKIPEGVDLGVSYRVKYNGKSWSALRTSGAAAGSNSNTVEAVEVSLTGADAANYVLYYTTYVDGKGWMAWTNTSLSTRYSGSMGYGYDIKGLQMVLAKKGDAKPAAAGSITTACYRKGPSVFYKTYLTSGGWTDYQKNGYRSGVSGKKVGAIKVKITSGYDLGIQYRVKMQDGSWTDYVANDRVSGSASQGKAIESLKMQLTGADKSKYDLYYCVLIKDLGWSAWAKNNAIAGSAGLSKPIAAIRVKVVKKGSDAPANLGYLIKARITASDSMVTYREAVSSGSWSGWKSDGVTAGSTSKGYHADGFQIKLVDQPYTGNISYAVYNSSSGWSKTVSNGTAAGGLKAAGYIERIRIKLTGKMNEEYSVFYRVHTINMGWSGWAANWEMCGTTNMKMKIDAVQVIVKVRGTGRPGSSDYSYVVGTAPSTRTAIMKEMTAKAQNYSSPTRYLALVDKSACRVCIFYGKKDAWSLIRTYSCAIGNVNEETIEGDFQVSWRVVYFDTGWDARAWYATHITSGNLFHSILYYRDPEPVHVKNPSTYGKISSGCIRGTLEDAKWVYDNFKWDSRVLIYH